MSRPATDPRGEWEFRCTSCGEEVDTDHQYCPDCDEHSGDWVLMDEDGEEVDTNTYGIDTFPELVKAADLFLKHLALVCERPEMQMKIDKHGNEAARIVRSGTRVAGEMLISALNRAKVQEKETA